MYGADMFIAFALSTVVFGFDYNKKVSLSDISEISAGIEHECSLSRSVRGPAPVDLEHLSMALEFFKDGYMDLDAVVDWRMAIEENSPEKIADPNWKISTRTNIVGLAEFVIFWTKFEKNGLVSIADFNTFFMNEQWTEESCSKVIDTIPTFVRVLKLMWLKSSKEKKRDIERQMNKL